MFREQLHAVFLALIVSRLRYALPARSGFLGREQVGQIHAVLKIIYRCVFSCEVIQVETKGVFIATQLNSTQLN